MPALYKPAFRREGVFHEIESLASRSTASAIKKEKDSPETLLADRPIGTIVSAQGMIGQAHIPGLRKLSSLALEPDDAITLRARILKFKFLTGDEEANGAGFESLRGLVALLKNKDASETELSEALWELGALFSSPHTSVSSFELIQSGLVDELLELATASDRSGTPISCSRIPAANSR